MPEPSPVRRTVGRWLTILRVLLAAAAVADLAGARLSVPAACCGLAACIPFAGRGFRTDWLGLPAALLGAWSVHRTGLEAASGLQVALFALPLLVALMGTLRADAPLYRVP